MDSLRRLFEDQLINDVRIPSFSIHVASFQVDFLAPNPLFFGHIITILSLQMFVACFLSAIMYYGIVLGSSKEGVKSISGYLIGYGLVIPTSLLLPFWLIDILDLRNVGYRMGLVCLPMTVTLRCLESMYGFVEEPARKSLFEYIAGSAFIVKPFRDQNQNLVPLTLEVVQRELRYHATALVSFAILFHIFEPFQWYPFPSEVQANQVWVSFDIGNLYNTFVQAFLTSTTLALSVSGCGVLASLLSGVAFDGTITDHPMFLSTSPSNFWGRRWNSLIHTGLKQGVYKPVRWRTGNRTLASITAFVASGIYHELVWKILFTPTSAQLADGMMPYDPKCCLSCYCYGWHGKQMVFFCWNGILIALEYLIGEHVGKATHFLPQWLLNHLVVVLSLPVGHLFTADLTKAGYFDSIRQALPLLLVVHKES